MMKNNDEEIITKYGLYKSVLKECTEDIMKFSRKTCVYFKENKCQWSFGNCETCNHARTKMSNYAYLMQIQWELDNALADYGANESLLLDMRRDGSFKDRVEEYNHICRSYYTASDRVSAWGAAYKFIASVLKEYNNETDIVQEE